jgi:hypothetical protein
MDLNGEQREVGFSGRGRIPVADVRRACWGHTELPISAAVLGIVSTVLM